MGKYQARNVRNRSMNDCRKYKEREMIKKGEKRAFEIIVESIVCTCSINF
jgi:hypothetical protein